MLDIVSKKIDFYNFIFGSELEKQKFINYLDPRFSELKTKQIKSLFLELKEDKWDGSWRTFVDLELAFCLGDFDSYLTQGYQKHIHNLTKKFFNLEKNKPTLYVSESCLLSSQKFIEEHRENQFKVLNYIRANIKEMNWMEFFNIMDEARKCNIVTVEENSRLQEFQLKSSFGDWKTDYEKASIKLINLCEMEEVFGFLDRAKKIDIILENIYRLRKRNFSGTLETINLLISKIEEKKF